MNNLTDITVIKDIADRYGFSFSKRFGQNFLINPAISPKMASLAGLGTDGVDFVLEIGPGIGTLTRELSKNAKKVVAVEIDKRLIPVLEETLLGYDNINIINDDIMKLDLKRLIQTHFGDNKIAVCANLPYYITSPVIMRLLENNLPISSVTAMVQKEAGVRICTPPGTRETGAITIAARYYSTPKILFSVKRGSFMPAPNVDSCVIKLDLREEAYLSGEDQDLFFKIVRGAFSQRRKTLTNSLSTALNMKKEDIIQILKDINLGESLRPEQLKLEDFLEVTKKFTERTALV